MDYISKGLQLRIYSLTDQQFTLLVPQVESSSIMDLKINWKKYGGVDAFTLTLNRDVNFLLFSGIRIDFYFDGVLWFTGYTEYVPSPDQDSEKIKIEGKGFHRRLEEVVINETYTSEDLEDIIDDICTTYLDEVDINYNISNIDVPTLTISDIEFKDKKLSEVFETLNTICNYDYSTEHYYWGVDETRNIYFSKVIENSDLVDQLFEGYDFQAPESKLDISKIQNYILAFRTKQASDSEAEHVGNYSNQASIDKYGKKTKKLTFSDFIDTTTIGNIANGLLDYRKDPVKRVSISDYKKQNKLDYGYYGINARVKQYIREVYDGSSTDLWDDMGISVTTIEEDDEIVFTGRRSLKITTAVGSAGEYIDLDLDKPIWFPQTLEILLYMVSEIINIEIDVYDTEGNTVNFIYGVTQPNLTADDAGTVDNLVADDAGTEDNLVSYSIDTNDISDQWFIRKLQLNNLLLNISKIRITFNIDRAGVLFVDRIITNHKWWWFNRLTLEEVEYIFNHDTVLSNITFGDPSDSLYDEVKNKVEEGNVAFDIFSKQ